MYNNYFGFRESPFSVTPDPRFFYTNSIYQEAFATLYYGITAKKGFIVITGEVGTGKTTLLRKLMRNLEATIHSVFIFNTLLSFTEMLQLTLRDLGLTRKEENTLTMIEQLNNYLIERLKEGHIVSLLIDEAQNLTDEVLERLRLLSNLETDKEKLLQIVLMGQPELKAKLDQLSMRQLNQRVALHCRLAPLNGSEVGPYIDFRLKAAGYEGENLFDPDAVEQIGLYSRGIPRLINVICDNGLLDAYGTSQKKVTIEMINEVAYDLGLKSPPEVAAMNAPAIAAPATEAEQEAPQTVQPRHLQRESRHRARVWSGCMVAVLLLVVGTVFLAPNLKNFLRSFFDHSKAEVGLETASSRSPEAIKTPKTTENDLSVNERSAATDNLRSQRLKQGSITSNANQLQYPPIRRKERESFLGMFEVVKPSLVRARPRSDAEIIAILQPSTQVKVVSTTGDYFRVQSMDGGTIRGYVHREDAFFVRSENSDLQPLSRQTARKGKASVEERLREGSRVIFLPSPILYRVVRDTTLVTRKDGARVFIPRGTKVHVAGFTHEDRAFVISRRGNPDGFIPKANLGEVSFERRDTAKLPTDKRPALK